MDKLELAPVRSADKAQIIAVPDRIALSEGALRPEDTEQPAQMGKVGPLCLEFEQKDPSGLIFGKVQKA